MTGFVFHPDVLDDLNEIVDFIAADSPAAAERVMEEIYKAIGALVSFPQMGHSRSDLTSRPIQFHAVRDLLIGYAPDENLLLILAVLNGRAILASLQPSCAPEGRAYFASALRIPC